MKKVRYKINNLGRVKKINKGATEEKKMKMKTSSQLNKTWLFYFTLAVLLMWGASLAASDYYDNPEDVPQFVAILALVGTTITVLLLIIPYLLAISEQHKKIILSKK